MTNGISFNTLGQTSFVSGLSGNDFTNIIKAEYQKDISATAIIQKQMVERTQKQARFKQMAELLNSFQSLSEKLSSSSFSKRKVTLNALGNVQPDKLMKITLNDQAPLGKLNMKVLQLAAAHKVASATQVSRSNAMNLAGTLSIKAGGVGAVDVTVSADMSLDQIASSINAKTGQTGVQATVLKVTDNAFKLVLSAQKTNETITLVDKTGSVAQSLGVLNGSNAFAMELSSPRPAKLEINGVLLQRNSNSINDALPGVQMDLLRADPLNGLSAHVETNRDGIKKEIQEFVGKYNKFRQFALSQQATIAGGGAAPGAHLFGDTVLKNVTDSIYKELTKNLDFNSPVLGLRSFGLSFDKDNTLKIDTAKLDQALLSDLSAARAFFAGADGKKGLGERLGAALKFWQGSDAGIIDKELKSLEKGIEGNRSTIADMTRQAEERRAQLVKHYARLEQQIAAAKLMMRQLEAIAKANSSGS